VLGWLGTASNPARTGPETSRIGDVGNFGVLSIDSYELMSTQYGVDDLAMSVFTEADRYAVILPREGAPSGRIEPIPDDWQGERLDDLFHDLTIRIGYRASARVVAERLEVMGVTLTRVRAAFERQLRDRADEIATAAEEGTIPRAGLAQMLREATFLDWSLAFQQLMADNIHPWPSVAPRELRTEMMEYIAEASESGSLFGLPGDARWLLRAVTEVCGPHATVEYDITRLVREGEFGLHQPIAEEAITALRLEAGHNAPTIVLTEGSTDATVLERAVSVLAPHLIGYITFLDFHGANAAGGTGPLLTTVRAFAAAGVVNRTIAFFDNDAAGRAAIRALERTRLPESLKVETLPDLKLARAYPTLGPTGAAVQDVNGRAASIEMYFGEDVLRGEDGDLMPVIWRNHETAIGDWQGELANKSLLQERFADKIRRTTTDPSLRYSLDWTGMRRIIERVAPAFSESDRDADLSRHR
jgi:hypothetical protein